MRSKLLLKIMLCLTALFLITNLTTPHVSIVHAASHDSVDDCLKNQDTCKDDTLAPVSDDDSGTAVGLSAWDYIKMMLALGFVVVLLYGVLKLVNSRNSKYQQNQLMQNLGGISLGQQKSVQLLKVGQALYIVGVGENVNMLKEVTDQNEKERLLELYNERQERSSQMPYILELLNKKKGRKNNDQKDLANLNFKGELEEQLQEMKEHRNQQLEEWKQKESRKNE